MNLSSINLNLKLRRRTGIFYCKLKRLRLAFKFADQVVVNSEFTGGHSDHSHTFSSLG